MALPAALVSALGFGLPVVAVATGAVLFATAGPVASPGGVGVATVWLDSPHEASVLAAGEVPVVVHATADRAPSTAHCCVVSPCASTARDLAWRRPGSPSRCERPGPGRSV